MNTSIKTRGAVKFGGSAVRWDLRNPEPTERYEIRLSHGEVLDFLLGWLVIDGSALVVNFAPALGFEIEPIASFGLENIDPLLSRAVVRWQSEIATKRKAG